ncbi:MAG: molybdate ABC transporter permease subunit [Verrucomicrobiota bacterium]
MEGVLPILLRTISLAAFSTLAVMLVGVPMAYLLARKDFPGKRALSALTNLPLVLPPTAIGYLLLRSLADSGPLGQNTIGFDIGILFTWKAVVLACAVMSFPLVVRTSRVSFESIDPGLEVMARTLGCSPLVAFIRVTIPLGAKGLIAAAILGFTRAIGEFGATVVVAGNIPNRTSVLSSSIYSSQQAGNQGRADELVLIALVLGFAAILLVEWLTYPRKKGDPPKHP